MVKRLFSRWLFCEDGAILSAEIVLVGTVLVLGLITGLTCLQQSLTSELQDLAGAFGALDQSYCFSGHAKVGYCDRICAYNSGSCFLDPADRAADASPQTEHKVPPFITYDARRHQGAPCPDCGRVHEHHEQSGDRNQERRSVRDPQNAERSDSRPSERRAPMPETRRRPGSDSSDSRNDESNRRSGDASDARDDGRRDDNSRSSRRHSDSEDQDRDDEDGDEDGQEEVGNGEESEESEENEKEDGDREAAHRRNPSDYVLTTYYSAMLGCDRCRDSGCDSCRRSHGCSSCGYSRPEGSCRTCGGSPRYEYRPACGSCGSYRCGGCGDYGYGPRERCTNVRHMRVSEWPLSPGPRYFPQQVGSAPNPPFPVYTPFHGNHHGPMPNGAFGPVPPGPHNGPASSFHPQSDMPPHDGYAIPPVPGAPREFRGPASQGHIPIQPGHYSHEQFPQAPVPPAPASAGVQSQWAPRHDGPHGPAPRVVYHWTPWNPYAGNRHEPRFPEYVW